MLGGGRRGAGAGYRRCVLARFGELEALDGVAVRPAERLNAASAQLLQQLVPAPGAQPGQRACCAIPEGLGCC